MEINSQRFFFCEVCNGVEYHFECCNNTTCNGSGCEQCNDRTEIHRRINAGEHPPIDALPVYKLEAV